MSDIHAGGIPAQGGKMLHPSSASDGDAFVKPTAGPSEQSATKGGPGTPHGSSDEGFVNDSDYKVASDQREGGMKVRDLNDVSHEA